MMPSWCHSNASAWPNRVDMDSQLVFVLHLLFSHLFFFHLSFLFFPLPHLQHVLRKGSDKWWIVCHFRVIPILSIFFFPHITPLLLQQGKLWKWNCNSSLGFFPFISTLHTCNHLFKFSYYTKVHEGKSYVLLFTSLSLVLHRHIK